uniref:Nuclear receptor domain-containing protein n=2 Tax=Biomphalaria glabrata TaxID=6526 RepID=A0A2C9LYF3_BIOGL
MHRTTRFDLTCKMGRKRKQVDTETGSKTNLPPCRVCDAPGAGFHYGANTCEACKGFFHRSLKLHEQYRCDGEGHCTIEHGLDKLCQLCRYQKCLSVGMGKDAIKTGRYTSVKRTNDILEVKKLQQTGKRKEPDSANASSSQILKLLTSPRIDSNSGSQSSCDNQFSQCNSFSPSNVNVSQFKGNFPDNQSFSSGTDHGLVQLSEYSPQTAVIDINPTHTGYLISEPLMSQISQSELCFPEKSSLLMEVAAASPNMSPLAVLSATATAVLTSEHRYSPLTPSEQPQPSESQLQSENAFDVSPLVSVNDALNTPMSPLSVGTGGPSSNSSAASSTCLNSQATSLDCMSSFCDSCGCHLKDKDISLMYEDYSKVVETLMEAHECFVVPVFGRLSPEEQLRQQLEHLENCRLHTEIFGTLPRLPDNEYDYIYETTGLDTDGRKHKYYRASIWLENMIRGMVKFAKAIPGFGKVITPDKVNLIKYSRQEFCVFSIYTTLNCELRVMRGGDNEWKCEYDIAKAGSFTAFKEFIEKNFNFCKTLQNLKLTEQEQVVIKAILIMAPDRFPPVESSLAHEIYWYLIKCLLHLLSLNDPKPNLKFAKIISRLTEARTMTENAISFLKNLKIEKYSNILENPLLREMMAGIIFDFKDDET